jgi:flagellar FliJ protein
MFTFKLQSVLDHRQMIEDNIKKELAGIRQRVIDNQRKLDGLMQKETDTANALKNEQAQGLASDNVVAYHAYLKNLSDRILKQRQVIEEVKKEAADKQETLLEAMKKRQILEKLKEQGMDRYRKDALNKERAFIDEIAVNQFVRSKMSGNGEDE